METLTYIGHIRIGSHYDDDDILFVDSYDEPFAEVVEGDLGEESRNVSVRYWISDAPFSKQELLENSIRILAGDTECKYFVHYSDETGYLWTDEELQIGGHDLLRELKDHEGKYLYLEIDVHK
jgi:hypothetical protein